jgi:hypothetical protein
MGEEFRADSAKPRVLPRRTPLFFSMSCFNFTKDPFVKPQQQPQFPSPRVS